MMEVIVKKKTDFVHIVIKFKFKQIFILMHVIFNSKRNLHKHKRSFKLRIRVWVKKKRNIFLKILFIQKLNFYFIRL